LQVCKKRGRLLKIEAYTDISFLAVAMLVDLTYFLN